MLSIIYSYISPSYAVYPITLLEIIQTTTRTTHKFVFFFVFQISRSGRNLRRDLKLLPGVWRRSGKSFLSGPGFTSFYISHSLFLLSFTLSFILRDRKFRKKSWKKYCNLLRENILESIFAIEFYFRSIRSSHQTIITHVKHGPNSKENKLNRLSLFASPRYTSSRYSWISRTLYPSKGERCICARKELSLEGTLP